MFASLRSAMMACLRHQRLGAARRWRWDVALLLAVTLAAALPRLILLGDIPPGLHGDEASFGLEARRILQTGNIGAMTGAATGTPAGTFYWTALFFAILGDNVYTLRLAYAVLGILTIPLAYLAFRVMFDRTTAVAGALLLAFSAWHIHYSRVAHVPIAWPLAETATMLALFLALRYESRLLFGLAGGALAAGIYTYGGYPIFVATVGVFLVWLAVFQYRRRVREFLAWVAVMAGVALLVGLPMASYAFDHPDDYTKGYRSRSVADDAEFRDAGNNILKRARVLVEREGTYLRAMTSDPKPDLVDAAGVFPLASWLLIVLIAPGAVLCFRRWREPPYAFLIIAIVVVALAPMLTNGAVYRRTLGLAPLLAAMGSLPLAWLWNTSRKWGVWAIPAAGAVVLAVGGFAAIDLTRYFSTYDDNDVVNFVFAPELAHASSFLGSLPDETYVYFYSSRWSYEYQTRQFIAPDIEGEDRSREFGPSGTVTLDADRTRDVVFVFLAPYVALAQQVQRLYPGGVRHDESDQNGAPEFSAYYLPSLTPGATPPPGATPVPTPTREVLPGGEDRDRMRLADMQRIQQALAAYQQKYHEFPTNGGAIQPLCTGETRDVGCQLSEFLDPMPRNPTGDYAKGYSYASNGLQYAIYAYRESDAVPECDEHPDELARLVDVMCVKGP